MRRKVFGCGGRFIGGFGLYCVVVSLKGNRGELALGGRVNDRR